MLSVAEARARKEYMVASGFLNRGHHFAPWFPQFTAVSDQKASRCQHATSLIIAMQVTCLLIPRTFLGKLNEGALLERLRETQESAYVSELEMAEKFIQQNRWERSRRQIYDDTLSKLKSKPWGAK